MRAHAIIVDDEESIRKLLKSRLERDGVQVTACMNADEAILAIQKEEPGLVVTDLKMPGRDGFSLMSWVREHCPQTRVILITGHGEKEVAIRALKQGACDYLEKPFDMDEFAHSAARALSEHALARENISLAERLEARVQRVEGKVEDQTWFVSSARGMAKVNDWLKVLQRESMRGEAEEPNVLILGESGTGKEGIARRIHASSRRARGPWVAVNCANFSEQLLESELFGHEKGAFTGATAVKRGLFELAQGGTLFLDEIGEMDVKLQAKLLRVLQERVFRRVGGTQDLKSDARVVAATNRTLSTQVSSGQFREDLYHRLNRVVIEVPALRDRAEDVVLMARVFAERAFKARAKKWMGFSEDAEEALQAYTWPGNVRELLNVVERAALLFEGQGKIAASYLSLPAVPKGVVRAWVESDTPAGGGDAAGLGAYAAMKKQWERTFEREYLSGVLRRNGGNVSAAAREARIDRSNLLRLLRKHGMKAEVFRGSSSTPTESGSEAA